jgi:hypothetical protein
MNDQPELIPGVRIDPPSCYDDVVEFMQNARDNGYAEIDHWSSAKLATEIYWMSSIDKDATFKDIEKSIRIWRERQGNAQQETT